MNPEHAGSVVARVLEQCKRPNAWALEHAGSQEEFDAINEALDACDMGEGMYSDRGACRDPKSAFSCGRSPCGACAALHQNRPCTSPRSGLCRSGYGGICSSSWRCTDWPGGVVRQPQTRPAASA